MCKKVFCLNQEKILRSIKLVGFAESISLIYIISLITRNGELAKKKKEPIS